MPFIVCPECKKELSDKAVLCPHCGYPLADENRTEVLPVGEPGESHSSVDTGADGSPQEGRAAAKTTYYKKLAVIAGMAVLLAAVLLAVLPRMQKITAENVKRTQLYNSALGFGVELGMRKSDIDEVLGTPEISYDEYLYTDQYLYTKYSDGKLVSIYIEFPNDRWITSGGITSGSDSDLVRKVLGEPGSIEHDGKWWYYRTNRDTITGVQVFSDMVGAIYIYDDKWAASQNPD